jgi:hypothetical protein
MGFFEKSENTFDNLFTKYELLMSDAPHQGCQDPLKTRPACQGRVPMPAVQFSPEGQTILA